MSSSTTTILAALTLTLFAQSPSGVIPDPPHACDACDAWNAPREPYRIFGDTYYVGTDGLSAVLVASDAGHILLDGALPQSAPHVERGIRRLGFRVEDIRLIVNSHAHYDHAGAIAAFQRASGAEVAASPAGARALERGQPTPDDPQYAFGERANAFPAAARVRAVRDGEVLRVGGLAITAHHTPGHTPGSTTWSWRACEGTACRQIVYADSLNPVSAPGFRYTDEPARLDAFRASIDTVAALPCDILIAVHPSFGEGKTCRSYAEDARRRLEARIREEQGAKPGEDKKKGPA